MFPNACVRNTPAIDGHLFLKLWKHAPKVFVDVVISVYEIGPTICDPTCDACQHGHDVLHLCHLLLLLRSLPSLWTRARVSICSQQVLQHFISGSNPFLQIFFSTLKTMRFFFFSITATMPSQWWTSHIIVGSSSSCGTTCLTVSTLRTNASVPSVRERRGRGQRRPSTRSKFRTTLCCSTQNCGWAKPFEP